MLVLERRTGIYTDCRSDITDGASYNYYIKENKDTRQTDAGLVIRTDSPVAADWRYPDHCDYDNPNHRKHSQRHINGKYRKGSDTDFCTSRESE